MDNQAKNSIWITYKIRMNSEARYKSYSLASHMWMSCFTFALITYSVFSDQYKLLIPNLDKVNICLSIASFSLSLILYGFKFDERANLFRECYLKLQSLYKADAEISDINREYAAILSQYPNHTENDYKDTIINLVMTDSKFDSSRYRFICRDYIGYYSRMAWKLLVLNHISPVLFLVAAIFLPLWSI